jgi:FKBP-type peptidyl-prolyl cis-trans isomerase
MRIMQWGSFLIFFFISIVGLGKDLTALYPASERGRAFLLKNATAKGVIVTDSGLQYRVIRPGEGKSPRQTDTVKVDYEGSLVNGTVFDSSYQRGEPIQFPVSGVIAGWQEALQLMKPGATWRVYIPSSLAYGAYGAGRLIGPNETLIFKVHLIDVKAGA